MDILLFVSRRYALVRSFGFATEGVRTALKREPNFRFHFVAAMVVMIAATILGFSSIEWVVLFFTISLVLILELINTSLEAIVDLVSPERRKKAKIAKDVSAAAVMVSAGVAVLVGIYLFLPKLF